MQYSPGLYWPLVALPFCFYLLLLFFSCPYGYFVRWSNHPIHYEEIMFKIICCDTCPFFSELRMMSPLYICCVFNNIILYNGLCPAFSITMKTMYTCRWRWVWPRFTIRYNRWPLCEQICYQKCNTKVLRKCRILKGALYFYLLFFKIPVGHIILESFSLSEWRIRSLICAVQIDGSWGTFLMCDIGVYK